MVNFLEEEMRKAEQELLPAAAPVDGTNPPPEVSADADTAEAAAALVEGKKIIFVLGGPGSGKGTQCERIMERYGFDHFSAGDLLRAEVQSGSKVGTMCANLMKEGKLVPVAVTLGLLRKSIEASTASAILIDGFPRALEQAASFESTVCDSEFTLFFDCPQEVMEERLLKRGETSGRADDNVATIKKRFSTFMESSLPVIEHYEAKGKVRKISAVPSPDKVFEMVMAVIEQEGFESLEGVDKVDATDETEEEKPRPKLEGKKIIFVLGGPGSGKGTQCERIISDFGFDHYSAGDLLRTEVKNGTPVGTMCANLMREGKLVPAEVTMALLYKSIQASTARAILIDGFPRALDQGMGFEAQICESEFTLFFDCPQEVMEERLLKRGETSGRADDNVATIKKRFNTFVTASVPVIEHYDAMDKVRKISAVPPPDDVYNAVKKVLLDAGFKVRRPADRPGNNSVMSGVKTGHVGKKFPVDTLLVRLAKTLGGNVAIGGSLTWRWQEGRRGRGSGITFFAYEQLFCLPSFRAFWGPI